MALNVVNWNVEWATPKSRRKGEILSRIDHNKPEVICLTEAHTGLLSRSGYTICAGADYGYTITEDRRKVLLWSREPWAHVDELGADSMPPGRYISGVTQTSLGPLTVIGCAFHGRDPVYEAPPRSAECGRIMSNTWSLWP